MANQAVVQERRKKIAELYSTGLTYQQIANQLDTDVGAVCIAMKRYREEVIKHMPQSESIFFADQMDNLMRRKRSLWNVALDPASSKQARIRALEVLGSEDDRLWKRAQTMGYVRPENMDGATIINADGSQVNVQNNTLTLWESKLREELLSWERGEVDGIDKKDNELGRDRHDVVNIDNTRPSGKDIGVEPKADIN